MLTRMTVSLGPLLKVFQDENFPEKRHPALFRFLGSVREGLQKNQTGQVDPQVFCVGLFHLIMGMGARERIFVSSSLPEICEAVEKLGGDYVRFAAGMREHYQRFIRPAVNRPNS